MATQYIRVTNPKFLEQDAYGLTAAGYKVYTLEAGTVATLVTTYSDKDLTVPNTNPIVLDIRGQAEIFTNVPLKLVYTLPDGNLSSPIWTVDYAANLATETSVIGNGLWQGNNLYNVDVVPTYASIPDGFSLVMIPDTTNLDTLVTLPANVFTGSGINDGTFSGPYIGTVVGAHFTVTIDSVFVNPPSAPTVAVSSADGVAGPPTTGVHLVAITFITAEGETLQGSSGTVTADGVKKIDVTGIAVGAAGTGVTRRRIYMTEAGGSDYYLVTEIADNVTTTYSIDIADADLILNAAAPVANTTGDGSGADTFTWVKDAGVPHTDISIVGNNTKQTLQEGVCIDFSEKTGHYIGDVWDMEVIPSVRINFCGLGADIVYKSVDGNLIGLDGGDIIENIPAHLDYSGDESCWILLNPTLPVLTNLKPNRVRENITAEYTVDIDDNNKELSCNGTFTVHFPLCSTIAHIFVWFRNIGTGQITLQVDAAAPAAEKIYRPFDPVGATTYDLAAGSAIMIQCNGVDIHVLSETRPGYGAAVFTASGTWTCPPGIHTVYASGCGGGAGGSSGTVGNPGLGGGAGDEVLKSVITVVPGTVYTITIPTAAATDTAGGDTVFGALLTISGGVTNVVSGQIIVLTDDTLEFSGDGESGLFGKGGNGGKDVAGVAATGFPGYGYGAGGGGGSSYDGGTGCPGLLILEW